jgi:hypothetical protein
MDRVAAEYGLEMIEVKKTGANPEMSELTQDELTSYSDEVQAQWWQRADGHPEHIPDGLLEGISIDEDAW